MNTSKIIKGVVGGGRYTVTAPIVKEDYGLYLKFEGIELPETYQMNFSNDEYTGLLCKVQILTRISLKSEVTG